MHRDTELGAKDLLNSRMAYVFVSRGRDDAQIYTNKAETLASLDRGLMDPSECRSS
jgi:hypothetical protein